jgi:hypothetical protein
LNIHAITLYYLILFVFLQFCQGLGFICEFCHNDTDIIFPFQLHKVDICQGVKLPSFIILEVKLKIQHYLGGQSQKDKLFCDLINKLYNVLLRNLFYFHSTKQTNLKELRSLIIWIWIILFVFLQFCQGLGFICEFCHNDTDIIFPFQLHKVDICPGKYQQYTCKSRGNSYFWIWYV